MIRSVKTEKFLDALYINLPDFSLNFIHYILTKATDSPTG